MNFKELQKETINAINIPMNFEELQEILNAINILKFKYNITDEDLKDLNKAINKAISRLMINNT